VRPRAGAVAAAFVVNGLGGPSFLPRLPERQAALGLSDAGLGVVLVGMAAGALVASPVAGRLIGTLGSRPVVVASALALGASLWTAGAAPTALTLALALALIGASDAAMDTAMNANAAAYEGRTGRSIMHRLHGAWSIGALTAAGVAALAAAARVSLTAQLAAIGLVLAGTVLVARPGLVPGRSARVAAAASDSAGSPADGARARWVGPLLVLGVLTVGGAIVEGAPTDWSALRLERLGTGPGTAALGVAAFMAGMFAGRVAGDHLTDRYGGAIVLRGGMTMVAAGLGLGVAVDRPAAFAAGLVLAGAGASAFFPLAFSAAARLPGVAPGAGAATVSLAARLGFLAEPLVVGALAEAVGLRWAFLFVACVAAALAAAAPRIVPPSARLDAAPITDVRAG
jgi:Major Facilitator Superfamily